MLSHAEELWPSSLSLKFGIKELEDWMRTPASLILLCVSTTAFAGGDGPKEPAYLYRAEVVRVVDGDTIDVDIDLGFYTWIKKQRIRMVGIDAPETHGAERDAGLTATVFLRNLVEGKEVILRTYKGRDGGDSRGKYGRWLGTIYLDGLDVNQHMIDNGQAIEYEH